MQAEQQQQQHHVIASVIDNRAKEVGLAVLDVPALTLHVCQHVEPGRAFATTRLILERAAPRAIVVVGTAHHEVAGAGGVNAALAGAAAAAAAAAGGGATTAGGGWELVPLPRSAFDDTRGILAVQALQKQKQQQQQPAGCLQAAAGRYLAYGAAGALLHYVSRSLGLALAPGVVRVRFDVLLGHHMRVGRAALEALEALPPGAAARRGVAGAVAAAAAPPPAPPAAAATAAGDRNGGGGGRRNHRSHQLPPPHAAGHTAAAAAATAARLQLRQPLGGAAATAAPRSAAASSSGSLLGFLDHTSTSCGARLLRTSLLQPLTDVPTLELRLDALQELLESPHLALELQALFAAQLPRNLDRLVSSLAVRPAAAAADGGGAWAGGDPSARLGRQVSAVVQLRNVLRSLPALADALRWADGALLRAVRATFADAGLAALLRDIEACIDDDAQPSGAAFASRVQQVFAARAAPGSPLDVARAAFARATEQVHELAARYRADAASGGGSSSAAAAAAASAGGGGGGGGAPGRQQQQQQQQRHHQWPPPPLPAVRVQYSAARGGFFMVVPEQPRQQSHHQQGNGNNGNGGPRPVYELPRAFVVLEKRARGGLAVTTHELNALNARLRDAAGDCLLLTARALDALVARLLGHAPLLLRLLDNVALLDVLLSFFAAVAGADGDFCRPVFHTAAAAAAAAAPTDDDDGGDDDDGAGAGGGTNSGGGGTNSGGGGPLVIARGRHPLLLAAAATAAASDTTTTTGVVVPNDVYISAAAPLHLVTGPNCSGKSTLLRTAGLLVLMAQVGCYVPAAYMALSPYTALHTRIGVADALEANASSFAVEMSEMAGLLAGAGPRALVLIDELGRATSTADGAAVAWAMGECLMSLGAHALLATHFRQLDALAATYPCVRLWRMQVALHPDGGLDFRWAAAPAGAASSGGGGDGDGDNGGDAPRHCGVLLARATGLPPAVADRALAVARQLDAWQARTLPPPPVATTASGSGGTNSSSSGGGSSFAQLLPLGGAHYALVHKLGCVARRTAAAGAAAAAAGAAAGDDSDNERRQQQQPAAAAADSSTGGDIHQEPAATTSSAAAIEAVRPLLAALKVDAERLLLAAARAG